jgi:hypothetical protein
MAPEEGQHCGRVNLSDEFLDETITFWQLVW